MAQFAYSFCISMLHSFWQTALLGLFYFAYTKLYKNQSPLLKRNILFTVLFLQSILFILTFCINFFRIENPTLSFAYSLANYLPTKNILLQTTNWFFCVYCLILFYKSFLTLFSFVQFKKTYKLSLQKPPIDIRLFATQKAFHLGIKKKIGIWYSNTIHTPITFGFLKPIILLPISLVNNISLQQTETLILHELAHIKANDYLLNWFIVVIEHLFFFNPFITILCRQLKLQRELHCDSTVVVYNYSPIMYAETLLAAAQQNKAMPSFSIPATGNNKQLFKRILFFTATNNKFSTKNKPFGLIIFLVLYAFIFYATLQTILPTKINTPSAKESMLFPLLGVESDLTFITKPIINKFFIEKIIIKKKSSVLNIKKVNTTVTKDININPIAKINELKLTPVSFLEEDVIQQVIIEEEQSGNKTSALIVYTIVNEDGQWILQPQWMVTKLKQDSGKNNIDSTLPFIKIQSTQ